MTPHFSFICRDLKWNQASECMTFGQVPSRASSLRHTFCGLLTSLLSPNKEMLKSNNNLYSLFSLDWRTATVCFKETESSSLAVITMHQWEGFTTKQDSYRVASCCLPNHQDLLGKTVYGDRSISPQLPATILLPESWYVMSLSQKHQKEKYQHLIGRYQKRWDWLSLT